MKEEIEYKWIVNLLNCPYAKNGIVDKLKRGSLKVESGCLKNFERYAKSPYRSKEFKIFFDELLNSGCIEFYERKKIKNTPTDFYIVNYQKMKKRIEECDLYIKTKIILNPTID